MNPFDYIQGSSRVNALRRGMKKLKICVIVAIVLIVAVVIFRLFNTSQKRVQLKMGTYVEITLRGPIFTNFDAIFDKAFTAIDEVEYLADRYKKKSQLSAVNELASDYPVRIDKELFDLIEKSIKISRNTDGAFDVTVSPLMKLWGFYRKQNTYPTQDEIKKALKIVGYENIILDSDNKSIFFTKHGIELDLSGIAKGYAVDKAAEAIKKSGINSAIISAGGDIYCIGKKNIFQEWNIGIKDPKDKKRIVKIVHLKDAAVATSGGYENFFEHRGVKYSHLIDPRSGNPVEASCGVTVIAENCTLADALATALCILNKEKGAKVKKKYNIETFTF